MTVYDFLRTTRSAIEIMRKYNITTKYVEHIDLYAEWARLKAEGHKSVYIVSYLADKYDKSEQRVWKIVKSMGMEI
jgi:N-methylhydantoinase A/oxoprolinase/acetone carboxylase beta subunit